MAKVSEMYVRHRGTARLLNNNNNNDITSMALKSSEARAQKRKKTKSVIIFKSRGHTGIIISRLFKRWKSNFEEISFEMFTERGKTFTRFQCGWEFIPNDGCSNRESTLAQVQLSSGNKKLSTVR